MAGSSFRARLQAVMGLAILVVLATLAESQSTTYGELTGVVRDAQGGVLPGATVTLYGAPVMGERPVDTDLDGSYVFRALTPGTYNLRFQMSGFAALDRRGLIVTTGTTVTINATLELEGVVESLTVTGDSPTLDTKMTRVGGTFNETALHDVPSATDVWAVLAQSPGIRMRGYDVGGSHKSQQTEYEAFGIREQSRVISDGVDSTEGSGYGTGLYYDYYSIEEFQVSAAGADVEMTSPGASLVMTVKSGGNELSGLFHIDYEGESFVGNNIDEDLAERGYTGNPNRLLWEGHADLGGAIVKDKVWFYAGYNHFKIDKEISGRDPEVATDIGIFDNIIGKLTFKLSDRDRLIGYSQWGRKQKPNRGLSLLVPTESTYDQDSWGSVHKAEWQRVWSQRAFSNVQVKHFGFRVDFEPHVPYRTNPRRIDTATGRVSGGHLFDNYFIRSKPQFSAQLSYYLPGRSGSHDLKLGFWWQNDSRQVSDPPIDHPNGAIFYLDNSRTGRPNDVNEIRLFNRPGSSDNRNESLHVYFQDTWIPTTRLTLNLGVRITRQHAYYTKSELNPTLPEFFPAGTVPARSLVTWLNAAPRLGASFDVSGKGKTVLKAYFGRFYVNIGDSLSIANPTSLQFRQYEFLDPNLNGLYDGPHELGDLVRRTSDTGGTPVNPDLKPSFADELSLSLERELTQDTSARFSYVHKTLKNTYGEWNRGQVLPLMTSGVPCGDEVFPCPPDPFTGEPLELVRVPDEAAGAQDFIIDTYPVSDSSYDTIQFALSRRFNGRFFIQGSFDYQWRDELRSAFGESRNPLYADPTRVDFWQNHSLEVSNRQNNTNWQAKLLGRYVFPRELATSVNLRHQSGWPWAAIHRVRIPGSGTMPIFLEDIDTNRSDNVTIFDVRLEKSFLFKRRHRLTAMLDVYNLFNSNAEINFVLRTGPNFRDIISVLDPRAVKIGIRWQF